ncbi:NAD(P)/FAD-dependent oxidoreductase [Microvirga mediterraneensis]|uniref:FAD-binding oxidoreductase n=1 Tax=Microvirga mediterraneensis TaxID=2754695 RepID=A0A838BG02_9HYPH|nr:FAD-binding oxidoreductase [Microvirga mediterraneensis]MBA1154530.1 FAD-binding oxidoreductase [Microvirga mediterraneensis]
MRIAIVGAGIVGLAAAHALLDRGHEVVLIDPGGQTARPTDGNAGWIAHTDIMPLASPKVWRNLPNWLMDPLGPLTIRPAYLPALTPWLMRFVLASSPRRIKASMAAIRAINAEALPSWKRLLSSLDLNAHLREKGILSVWKKQEAFLRAKDVLDRQRDLGIGVEILDQEQLANLEPALHNVEAGVLFPEACHISDPAHLASDLKRLALARGAQLVAARVLALEPDDAAIHIRMEGAANAVVADRAVIAAGVWSRPLAKMLGDDVPLDTERGYNATYPKGSFGLDRPVMFEGEGFVTTPLDTGDRVGGAVEFAGLDAKPNHDRTSAMIARLRRFLPDFKADQDARRWMGFRPSIPDSLPVIGPSRRDRRIVYAFGHGHHGLTQAAVTSRLVADLIDGMTGEIDLKPYSAQRF